MMNELKEPHIATLKDAAQKLTGAKRRAFQARVALSYCNGSARRAAAGFGWSRRTVSLGLHELRTGITCVHHTAARGNRKTEEKWPQLAEDRRSLAEPHSQVDPKFQSPFWYTRITAKAMRQALIDKKSWQHGQVPCENTIGNILNRLGYRLRRVQKAKPVKRVRDTAAIFAHVHWENQASDARADSLRISMDTTATLNVGAFSRGGKSRGSEAIPAWDHDMRPTQKLVPCGILEVLGGLLTILFGTSRETSDFLADGLHQWWNLSKNQSRHIRQLVIDLDNGPQNARLRTQFMHRMVEFADRNAVEVVLVYYPPYHSKYNPIERCWGILEAHWHGTVLETVDPVLHWARTMTWKAVRPVVQLLDKVYANGVRVAKKAFRKIEERLERHVSLPKYGVRIQPQGG
jgi:Rhodopirellula transposase DDE domain